MYTISCCSISKGLYDGSYGPKLQLTYIAHLPIRSHFLRPKLTLKISARHLF